MITHQMAFTIYLMTVLITGKMLADAKGIQIKEVRLPVFDKDWQAYSWVVYRLEEK